MKKICIFMLFIFHFCALSEQKNAAEQIKINPFSVEVKEINGINTYQKIVFFKDPYDDKKKLKYSGIQIETTLLDRLEKLLDKAKNDRKNLLLNFNNLQKNSSEEKYQIKKEHDNTNYSLERILQISEEDISYPELTIVKAKDFKKGRINQRQVINYYYHNNYTQIWKFLECISLLPGETNIGINEKYAYNIASYTHIPLDEIFFYPKEITVNASYFKKITWFCCFTIGYKIGNKRFYLNDPYTLIYEWQDVIDEITMLPENMQVTITQKPYGNAKAREVFLFEDSSLGINATQKLLDT